MGPSTYEFCAVHCGRRTVTADIHKFGQKRVKTEDRAEITLFRTFFVPHVPGENVRALMNQESM